MQSTTSFFVNSFLMLDLKCDRTSAEAYINGIPVARVADGPGKTLRMFRPVNEFIVAGTNILTLVVAPGDLPSLALIPYGVQTDVTPASVTLTLSRLPEGAFYDDPAAERLLAISWQSPVVAFSTPVVLNQSVELQGNGQNWAWRRGGVLPDRSVWKSGVFELLRYLRERMQRRDLEPYIQLADPRYLDIAAAYQIPAEDRLQQFREQFARISTEDNWEMEQIDMDRMDPRICADGRLIECVDTDWLPSLRTTPLENGVIRLRFPTFLAVIDGQWRIVL